MKEKNIYQKQAVEMLKRILRVTTHKFSIVYKGMYNDIKQDIHLCKLNGEKYIFAGDVFSGFVSRISTMLNKGFLTKYDIYYFYGSERVNCFVKVAKIDSIKDDLVMQFADKWGTEKSIIPVVEYAMEAEIPNEVVSPESINDSVKAYRLRNELLAKSKEYNAEQGRRIEAEYERKQEEERIEREKNEEKTLRSLVSQIEAMGWHVSLTLKDNG